jgi:hypothetical protein
MAEVVEDGEGDTIYSVDRVSESMLVSLFDQEIARGSLSCSSPKDWLGEGPYFAVAAWSRRRLGGLSPTPDGTRSLRYQKRSAWILTGVASNRAEETSLADIELAVQTQLPRVKQHLCDTLRATRGVGLKANASTGSHESAALFGSILRRQRISTRDSVP